MNATRIITPSCYMVEVNNKVRMFKVGEMRDAFAHLYYQGPKGERPFVKEWLADKNIQVKEAIGSYPRRSDCPSNIFNMWKD